MEDNRNISEQVDNVDLVKENEQLKQALNQVYKRCQQLENTWMLTRADMLFKVVENNKFSPETRQKAQEELENFLFPQPKEDDRED